MFAATAIDPIVPALIGAMSGLVVVLIGAWLGYLRYLAERRHSQETLLNALFGELANVYEHYSYSLQELPIGQNPSDSLRLRLRWSSYGDLCSARDVSEYGFLTASDVRLLLQLSLRIRNNDMLLEELLSDLQAVTPEDLLAMRDRMSYVVGTTQGLINRLVISRPQLQKVWAAVKADLPT